MRILPILFVLASCASAPRVFPHCPCSVSRHLVERDYERADVVFVGTVVSVSFAPQFENSGRRGIGPGPRVTATLLRVVSLYKGEGAATQFTLYSDTAWACAYPFVVGETYVVYAWNGHRFKNQLTTTGCVRTAPYDEAQGDIKKLRALRNSRSKK